MFGDILLTKTHEVGTSYRITVPRAGYLFRVLFLARMGLTFLLVFSIFRFKRKMENTRSHRLMRWTLLIVRILVAVTVWLKVPNSGNGHSACEIAQAAFTRPM